MAAPLNVLTSTWQFYHQKTMPHVASKSTYIIYICMLPQLKIHNCSCSFFLSSFFSSQPSALMREVTQLKQLSTMRKISMVPLCLAWNETTAYIEHIPMTSDHGRRPAKNFMTRIMINEHHVFPESAVSFPIIATWTLLTMLRTERGNIEMTSTLGKRRM